MTALGIINPAMIAAAIDVPPHILRLYNFAFPAKFRCQKLGIALHRVEMRWFVGCLQMPCLQVTVDAMFGDSGLHPSNRTIGQIKNRLCPFASKFRINLAH